MAKKGRFFLRAVIVDALGEKLFARAALPVDKDRGVRGRRLPHDAEKGLHAPVVADDVVQVELVEKLVLEHQVVFKELDLVGRIVHDEEELVLFEGLFQVMERAELRRLYCGRDGAVGGHDDDVARDGSGISPLSVSPCLPYRAAADPSGRSRRWCS